MIKAILNGLLNALKGLIDIILIPVNLLVENLFPQSIVSSLGNFNNFLNNYVGSSIGWFSNLLPPIFKSLVVIALTFMIGYYAFVWSYTAIVKIYNVIQKIKFW